MMARAGVGCMGRGAVWECDGPLGTATSNFASFKYCGSASNLGQCQRADTGAVVLGPRGVSAEVPETKVCSKLPSLLQTLRRPFAFANCKQRRNFPEKRTILEPKPTLRCQKRRKIGFGGASKPKNPQNEALSKENPALRTSGQLPFLGAPFVMSGVRAGSCSVCGSYLHCFMLHV